LLLECPLFAGTRLVAVLDIVQRLFLRWKRAGEKVGADPLRSQLIPKLVIRRMERAGASFNVRKLALRRDSSHLLNTAHTCNAMKNSKKKCRRRNFGKRLSCHVN